MAIRRGEVYLVDLKPIRGSEMDKERPAVIVSNDRINNAAQVIIVCPITDSSGKESPIHIEIPEGEGGLVKDSVAHCAQIRAISKERIGKKIGELDKHYMAKISKSLKIALDINL